MSAHKYILERSLLRPGDIVLTGDKRAVSLSIKVATMSRYSHAAIYVGGTIIEATLNGVFSKSPQRLIFDRPTDVLVLRAKRPLSEQEAFKICDYAQSKVGSLYALNEAVTIKYRSLLRYKDTSRQFCSRLVAKSYEHAGFDLINLRDPAFCSPRQLALCKAFEPVQGLVRPANTAEVRFSESDDPAQENLRMLYDWLNKVRELSRKADLGKKWDIQSVSDADGLLFAHSEYDDQISKYLENSGYLQFYTIEARKNPYRYKVELFFHYLSSAEDAEGFVNDELSKEVNIFRRFTTMQSHYAGLFKEKKLNFFRLQLQLYHSLVSEILIRTLVVRDALVLNDDVEAAAKLNDSIEIVERAVRYGKEALEAGLDIKIVDRST